jgi:transcription elongation factor SPT5
MSTSNLLNAQFDDSEDEDDFNPQPADLSDDGGDDDAGVQIRKEAARTRVDEDEGSDDEAPASRRKSAHGQNGDDDDDDEDAEGEGEDITQGGLDDDEEEDEEDEEEEITVSPQYLFWDTSNYYFLMGHGVFS